MSEHDETNGGPPEFVAVTPRGGAADHPAASPAEAGAAHDPTSGPVSPHAPSPASSGSEASEPGTASESAPAPAADAVEAEPATAPAPAVGTHPPDEEQPAAAAPATASEPVAAAESSAEPVPAATAEPAEPVPAATAEPATATTPSEPDPPKADDPEVSVRAAAEGMAAALAGEPRSDAEADATGTRSVGPLALATAVLVVLALAAAALLAVTARSNSHHRAVDAARAAALDAAKRETALALTYDYRTLDADFQRAEAGMSRRFRANYAQTAATSVTPLAQKTHAVTTGTITAGGVVSATPDTARILVFANQVVQNARLNATSRLDRSVIEVAMVKEDGRWVIDNLQPF